MKISCLTVATAQGVKMYPVEPNKMGAIASIKVEAVYYNGSAEEMYIGRDATGNELLRVHPSAPIVIDYDYK